LRLVAARDSGYTVRGVLHREGRRAEVAGGSAECVVLDEMNRAGSTAASASSIAPHEAWPQVS
jgi:hypothetical protein